MKKELLLLASVLLFSFINPVPAQKGGPAASPPAFRMTNTVNEEVLKSCCEKLEKDKRRIFTLTARSYRMSMQLRGVYVREGMIFFRLDLRNHSNLDYDTDSIRFTIRDSRVTRSGPVSVIRLAPAFVYGDTRMVRGKSKAATVIVIPRFTLAAGKLLVIEALEKNGGRHLQLRTGNAVLVNSRQI